MSYNPANIPAVASVAALLAIPLPQQYVALSLMGYYAPGDGGGGEVFSVFGGSPGTYVTDHVTTFVPTGGDGSSAYVRVDNKKIDARQGGAKCDNGVTDDSTAWGWILAVSTLTKVYLPSDSLILSTQTATGSNLTISGPGRLVSGPGSYTLIQFNGGSPKYKIGVRGTLNNQQYGASVSGATIAASFPSSGFTFQELTTTSATTFGAHVTASKSGTIVSIALTSDAALNMTNGVAVVGSPVAVNSGDRNVIFGGTNAAGTATAAPRFITSAGSEYIPGGNLGPNNFDYLTGVTSFYTKFGTGRYTNTTTLSAIPGYVGAAYDASQLIVKKLVNDFATWDFTTGLFPAIVFNGCTNAVIGGQGVWSNLWACSEFIDCVDSSCAGTIVKQCVSGHGATAAGILSTYNVLFYNNNFDGKFLDDAGIWREQVVYRGHAIVGNLENGSMQIEVSNNNCVGFNWFSEWINSTHTTALTPQVSFIGNTVDVVFQGISTNATFKAVYQGNTLTSNFPWCSGGIEEADDASNASSFSGNTIEFTNICAQVNTGIAPYGTGIRIVDNPLIQAAIPISHAGVAVIGPCTIKSNLLRYGCAGTLLRDVLVKFTDNIVEAYCDGYLDGLGYGPAVMSPLYIDFTVESAPYPILVKNNDMDVGLTYNLLANCSNLQVLFNNFFNPYNYDSPLSIFGLIPATVSVTAITHQITDNKYNAPGIGFTSNAIAFGQVPTAGGTSMIGRNATMTSAGAGFTVANSNSYTGAGSVSVIAA